MKLIRFCKSVVFSPDHRPVEQRAPLDPFGMQFWHGELRTANELFVLPAFHTGIYKYFFYQFTRINLELQQVATVAFRAIDTIFIGKNCNPHFTLLFKLLALEKQEVKLTFLIPA